MKQEQMTMVARGEFDSSHYSIAIRAVDQKVTYATHTHTHTLSLSLPPCLVALDSLATSGRQGIHTLQTTPIIIPSIRLAAQAFPFLLLVFASACHHDKYPRKSQGRWFIRPG